MSNEEQIERFEEIMGKMRELADEALGIIEDVHPNGSSSMIYQQATYYWYPHILGAIDEENSGYVGGSMFDMASAVRELKELKELKDEEDEDYNETLEQDEQRYEDKHKKKGR